MNDPVEQPSAPHKDSLIERIIEWSARNKFMVFMLVGALARRRHLLPAQHAAGRHPRPVGRAGDRLHANGKAAARTWSKTRSPIPSSPSSSARRKVRVVRGYSFFGYSFVYVIFKDGTDIYWARSRVLEYMQGLTGNLPPGVTPTLGPDATGVGWGFQYALVDRSGKNDLARPALLPGLASALLDSERRRRRRSGHLRRLRETVSGGDRSQQAAGLQRPHQPHRLRHPQRQQRRRRTRARTERHHLPRSRQRLHPSRSTTCAWWWWAPMPGATPVLLAGRGPATSPSARRCGAARATSTAKAKPSAASSWCASARTCCRSLTASRPSWRRSNPRCRRAWRSSPPTTAPI